MTNPNYETISDEAALIGICAANTATACSLASAIAGARFSEATINEAMRMQMREAFVTIAVANKAMEQVLRLKSDIRHTQGLQSDRISDMLDPVIYAINDEHKRARATLKTNIDALPYYWAD